MGSRRALALRGRHHRGCAPVITIHTPARGASAFSMAPITFSATATDHVALTSMTLQAGSVTLQTCAVGSNPYLLDCSAQFNPTDVAAQIQGGQLVLAASATDSKRVNGSQTVTVAVKPIVVTITEPMVDATSMVANVKGMSNLTVTVQSAVAVQQVQVNDMLGHGVAMFSPPSYTKVINWEAFLGIGANSLTATATDVMGNTDSQQIALNVLCQQDGDCNPGQSCCVAVGLVTRRP